MKPTVLIAFTHLAALLAVACASGSPQVVVPPGQISCEPIENLDSYRYRSTLTLEAPRPDDPALVDDPYPPFKETRDMDGAVQGRDRRQVLISNPDVPDSDLPIVVIGDTVYEFLAGWQARPADPIVPAISFLPLTICQSLQPEVDLGGISSTPEEVNGIATKRFELQASPEFASRLWGASSDISVYIPSFDVTIWVTEDGSWPVRAEVRGLGRFENGRELRAEVSWELRDINDKDIKIEPPIPAN